MNISHNAIHFQDQDLEVNQEYRKHEILMRNRLAIL